MQLDINPRGNGACPLCRRLPDCRIRKLLVESVASLHDSSGTGMEIALYTCPSFSEKDRP